MSAIEIGVRVSGPSAFLLIPAIPLSPLTGLDVEEVTR